MRCRICGTTRNLKFTPQQVRSQTKKSDKLKLLLSELPPTTGNICNQCDERLRNFHHLENEDDVVDVVDVVDERIFDIFFEKRPAAQRQDETQRFQTSRALTNRSLGSDGDAEIIEVLTSRETTPELIQPKTQSDENRNAVATAAVEDDVIDVEQYPELENNTGSKCYDSDDDEIIFESVSPSCNAVVGNLTESSRKRRRNRAVNYPGETRLLGCLSLISSDSEAEEHNVPPAPRRFKEQFQNSDYPHTTANIELTNGLQNNSSNVDVPIEHTLPTCKHCGIRMLDEESLQFHMREHDGFNCPVCSIYFSTSLKLVSHMRQKHRSYDGNELVEGMRCSHDSHMTIRLRLLQRFTFYECQLCGCIDSVFQVHKLHIVEKHADESKSLRDPMTKELLKCPVCKQNCGSHHVDVCRHLLAEHNPMEYEQHMDEAKNLSSLRLNEKNLKKVEETARIFKLKKHENCFLECKICKRVYGAGRSFLKHLNGHSADELETLLVKTLPSEVITTTEKAENLMQSIEPTERKIGTRKSKLEQTNTVSSAKDEIKNPTQRRSQPELNDTKKSTKSKRHTIPCVTKPETPTLSEPSNNQQQQQQRQRQKKPLRKIKKDREDAAVVKVKIRAPLKNFPTQKYKCNHCQMIFKGFCKLHWHLLRVHSADEYIRCVQCPRLFKTQAALTEHQRERHRSKSSRLPVKRKTSKETADILDENCNEGDYKPCLHVESDSQKSLVDIQQLPAKKKQQPQQNEKDCTDCNSNTASKIESTFPKEAYALCRYCQRIMISAQQLQTHEKVHHQRKDMPAIIFKRKEQEIQPFTNGDESCAN